jgi:CoA:oxalate CoA-transferase
MFDQKERSTMDSALEGVRVLDLGEIVSGSYCAKLLGAFGAEVIKVERPGQGDPARHAGPFLNDHPHPECSALFLYLNTNKKSISLNIHDPAGAAILKELAQKTDVVIENFPPGTLPRAGLSYEVLESINPNIIMASITDFGQTGPYRDFKGGRLSGYALGGYAYINGDPDREPLAGAGDQPAYQGGLHAYAGVMAALLQREFTGAGQYIDVSIMECMASLHQFTVNRYAYSGMIQKRGGNKYMFSHPIAIYPCKDGYVSICPSTEDQAERMFIMMDKVHLLEDERFQTGFHRLVHADEFDAIIAPWFTERTKKEIVALFQEFRVPAAPVNNMKDLLDDPQYIARDFWTQIDHPAAGKHPYPHAPFKLSETPARPERAPLLGEHNEEIYCKELGMAKDEWAKLREEGVI